MDKITLNLRKSTQSRETSESKKRVSNEEQDRRKEQANLEGCKGGMLQFKGLKVWL